MLGNEGQASTIKKLLDPASAANTAAATSSYVSMIGAEGDLVIEVAVGTITGSFTPTFEHASDSGGTGSAAIVPNEGAIGAMTANTVAKRTIRKDAIQGFLRIVGTIVTGPVLCQCAVAHRQKNF
jgi:hypothetical protein